MMGVIVFFAVSLLAFWASSRDQINRFVHCSIFLVFFIPYEFFSVLSSVEFISKISPFALFVFLFYFFELSKFKRKYFILPLPVIPFLILLLYVIILTSIRSEGRGWGTIFDNYIAVFLCLHFLSINKNNLGDVRVNPIINMYVISSLFIVFEFVIRFNIPYNFLFSKAEWIETQWEMGYHRSTGGIGHPLIVSSLYLILLGFVNSLSVPHKGKLFFLGLLVIISTGSRAGFFLAILFSTYTLYKKYDLRLFFTYFFSVSILCLALYVIGLFDFIIYRLFNADGSTAVRLAVLDILDEVWAIGLFGEGIGSTGDFIERVNFYNAIEVTWVSFIVEIGFLGTSLFLFSWFFFVYVNNYYKDNIMLFFVLFMMVSSYNSLVVHTPIMFIFCMFIALSSVQKKLALLRR